MQQNPATVAETTAPKNNPHRPDKTNQPETSLAWIVTAASQNPLGLFSKKRFAHPQVVTAGFSRSPRITNSVCGSFA
jgi:hypothetical protein